MPSAYPSSGGPVTRPYRLGITYDSRHAIRQPPFRLQVHAHAGHTWTAASLPRRRDSRSSILGCKGIEDAVQFPGLGCRGAVREAHTRQLTIDPS